MIIRLYSIASVVVEIISVSAYNLAKKPKERKAEDQEQSPEVLHISHQNILIQYYYRKHTVFFPKSKRSMQ